MHILSRPERRRAYDVSTRGPEDWRAGAPCLDEEPELFFPVGDGPAAQEQITEAKIVCAGCEAREVCLEWALGRDAKGRVRGEYGVWGGLSEDERRAEMRRRSRRSGRAGVAA